MSQFSAAYGTGQHSEKVHGRQARALCKQRALRTLFVNRSVAPRAIVFSGGLVTMSLRESLERQDSHRMPKRNSFEHDLDKNAANYTPLSLIARTAYVYPNLPAVVHGKRRYTWAQTYERSRRLASALAGLGIRSGDTVALMASNTPEMIEAHFGVPMLFAVTTTLNSRLDAEALCFW